jgi:Flp pilus assembly protein TadD
MHRHIAPPLARGLVALGLLLAPLYGCSSLDFGSSFGGAPQPVAQLPDTGNMTADVALASARSHFRNSDFGYSAELYKKVVELSPKNPEGYVGLGASYDQLGRFDLSDRVYATLYKLTGGTTQYYNNLGYSYLLRGDTKSALANFRKANSIDPGNVVVANNLRLLASATGRA